MVPSTRTDYSKKKVDELQDLLKARKLSHGGKKADLIARLQAADTEAEASESTPTATVSEPALVAHDQDVSSVPTATALAAGGKGQLPNPTAVPNQVAAIDPSTTDDLVVEASNKTKATATDESTTNVDNTVASETKHDAEPTAPATTTDFTSHLPASDLSTELDKRKSRAVRFGTAATSTVDEDAQKALDRAARFGTTGEVAIEGLDRALPERAGRKRGRGLRDGDGAEGEAAADTEGREGGAKRRDSRMRERRGRRARGNSRGRGNESRSRGNSKGRAGGGVRRGRPRGTART